MPIDDAWATLYPDDWDAISAEVREDAGHKCEWCGAPNGRSVVRLDGEVWWTDCDDVFGLMGAMWRNGDETAEGRAIGVQAATWIDEMEWNVQQVDIVLTVAHLDQDPRNCARENLRALCQACHLGHDRQPAMRERRRVLRAEVLNGQTTMFGDEA